MQSEIIKQEENKITLKLVVSAGDFEKAVDKAYGKLKGKFNIPGFRKGKAPKKIIEVQYGKEVFYEEAVNICLPDAYEAALDAHKIEPIDRPVIDFEDIVPGEDVVFTAVVEVMPEFTLGNYKGIEVAKKEYNVQEEDVEKALKEMQEKNGRMISVEDRPVKDGDLVIIDYKGTVDGVAFDGGTAEKQSLTIGSGQFIPGFEEQLIGANLGADIEVKVTFPSEYHAEELAGKDATFEVKLHEIKEKELPALDDEFAKDVSEFDTLEALKADEKAKLEEKLKEESEQALRNELVEAAVAQVEFEVPAPVVERQLDGMIRDFGYQLSYQGLNLEYYYQVTNITEADMRAQMRPDAVTRVKTQLVLEKIGEVEGIEATEEDLEQEIVKLAAQYKQGVDQFKERLRETDLNYFKENIVMRKTIDFLVEHAAIA